MPRHCSEISKSPSKDCLPFLSRKCHCFMDPTVVEIQDQSSQFAEPPWMDDFDIIMSHPVHQFSEVTDEETEVQKAHVT